VAPTPFTPEARHEFRRRLPWVDLTELSAGTPAAASEQELQGGAAAALMLAQTDAAVIQHNSQPAEQMSATTDEANSPVNRISSNGKTNHIVASYSLQPYNSPT